VEAPSASVHVPRRRSAGGCPFHRGLHDEEQSGLIALTPHLVGCHRRFAGACGCGGGGGGTSFRARGGALGAPPHRRPRSGAVSDATGKSVVSVGGTTSGTLSTSATAPHEHWRSPTSEPPLWATRRREGSWLARVQGVHDEFAAFPRGALTVCADRGALLPREHRAWRLLREWRRERLQPGLGGLKGEGGERRARVRPSFNRRAPLT